MQMVMVMVGSGSQDMTVKAWSNESAVANANNYVDGTLFMTSPVFTVPQWFAATSGGFVILGINFSAAGTALTINMGRITFQRIA